MSTYLWLTTAFNYENGFTLSFKVYFKTTINPADGFAVVLQQNSYHASGYGGGGLNVGGINDAFAIEFDSWYNSENGDPSIEEHKFHISVQARNGIHCNNENDSIGWQYHPVNFFNSECSSHIGNGVPVKIEHLLHMLRVTINGITQISIQEYIYLPSLFLHDSDKYYLGFTGATGGYNQEIKVTNVNLQIAKYNVGNTVVSLLSSANLVAGDYFSVGLKLRDNCGNVFVPNQDGMEDDIGV